MTRPYLCQDLNLPILLRLPQENQYIQFSWTNKNLFCLCSKECTSNYMQGFNNTKYKIFYKFKRSGVSKISYVSVQKLKRKQPAFCHGAQPDQLNDFLTLLVPKLIKKKRRSHALFGVRDAFFSFNFQHKKTENSFSLK